MAMSLFGWDLLYSSVEKDIKNNQDVLVCLSHLVLVSNGFKCIGLGESKNIDGTESKSEALPKKWNEDYAIRYVYQGRLYNFRATPMDDAIMINLIRVDERNVSLIQLNTRSVVQKTGTLDEMIPDNKNIVEQIKTQLIDKVVVSKKSKDMSSQTESSSVENRGSFPRSSSPPSPAVPMPFVPLGPTLPYGAYPPGYGSSDLDPFANINPLRGPSRRLPSAGGGGMLFQPPGPSFSGNQGVAPGSLPPGARFDPFRPPDSDRFPPRRPPNRPDNDEFPPPGYDDMFM